MILLNDKSLIHKYKSMRIGCQGTVNADLNTSLFLRAIFIIISQDLVNLLSQRKKPTRLYQGIYHPTTTISSISFTTTESESVVRHPVRRRIIMWLMLAGSAGIVAVIASVVLTVTMSSGSKSMPA